MLNNVILLQLQQKRVFGDVCTYSHRHEEVNWDRTPQTKELLLLKLTNQISEKCGREEGWRLTVSRERVSV